MNTPLGWILGRAKRPPFRDAERPLDLWPLAKSKKIQPSGWCYRQQTCGSGEWGHTESFVAHKGVKAPHGR